MTKREEHCLEVLQNTIQHFVREYSRYQLSSTHTHTHHQQVGDFPRVALTHALAEPCRCDYATVYKNKEPETTSKAMNVRTTK